MIGRRGCYAMGVRAAVVLLGTALALAPAPALAAAGDRHQELVRRVIEQHLLPRFAALTQAAAKLPPAVQTVCTTSDGEAEQRLRGAFRDTVAALAAVDFYRFGPLAEQGRRERLAFWPDPRGAMSRQLRALLAAGDAALLQSDGIVKQSAAVQGLPALEVLIAAKDPALDASASSAYRCDLAQAIARNVAALTAETELAWTSPGGMRDKMLGAGPGHDTYKTHAEAAAELLKSLLTGLQAVAELQIKPRLEPRARVSNGPYAKLGLEREIYSAAVTSLQELYAGLDLESNLAPDKAWMKNWAHGAWRAMQQSDGMGGAARGVEPGAAPSLKEVASRIGGLRQLIGREMSNAAGIAIGFNELDGD